MLHDVGGGGDGDEPPEGAVQAPEQIDAAEDRPRQGDGGDEAGRAGEVRVDEHDAHRDGVGDPAQREL